MVRRVFVLFTLYNFISNNFIYLKTFHINITFINSIITLVGFVSLIMAFLCAQ